MIPRELEINMICSFLLLSSCIAAAFSASTFEFTETPDPVFGRVGGSVEIVWEYDLGGSDLLGTRFEHRDMAGQLSAILDVNADGDVTPGSGFPDASFKAPATLTLNELRDTDEGEVKCTIVISGNSMSDLVPLKIVPPDDQKEFNITLKVLDNEVECGEQTLIDFDETIKIDVPLESDSGAPMDVNAFQKCGEGQENQIGPECTKGSDNCTFETSAGCDGFTEGLVTIRATVKHPAFDEAKEAMCSYTVQDPDEGKSTGGDPLSGGVIAGIVIGVLLAVALAGGAAYFFVIRKKPDKSERRGAEISM